MHNCTISVVKPDIINEIHGKIAENTSLCLEAHKHYENNEKKTDFYMVIITTECEKPIHPMVQLYINENVKLNKNELNKIEKRNLQKFNFFVEDKNSYKEFL